MQGPPREFFSEERGRRKEFAKVECRLSEVGYFFWLTFQWASICWLHVTRLFVVSTDSRRGTPLLSSYTSVSACVGAHTRAHGSCLCKLVATLTQLGTWGETPWPEGRKKRWLHGLCSLQSFPRALASAHAAAPESRFYLRVQDSNVETFPGLPNNSPTIPWPG